MTTCPVSITPPHLMPAASASFDILPVGFLGAADPGIRNHRRTAAGTETAVHTPPPELLSRKLQPSKSEPQTRVENAFGILDRKGRQEQ